MKLTPQEAIKRIREFGLHHAIRDLPNSAYTVEAFDMAIEALNQPEIIYCKDCKYFHVDYIYGIKTTSCRRCINPAYAYPTYYQFYAEENMFCSCAERKDNG